MPFFSKRKKIVKKKKNYKHKNFVIFHLIYHSLVFSKNELHSIEHVKAEETEPVLQVCRECFKRVKLNLYNYSYNFSTQKICEKRGRN